MGVFRQLFGLPEPPSDGQKSLTINSQSVHEAVVTGWPTTWGLFEPYGALYRSQPAVRTVVDFLARNVAQLNPKIYMRLDNQDRVEWNDHPVAELLRRPNPMATRYSHLRDTVADIAIYDRAYWEKMRVRGLVRGLVRIPPSRITVEFDHDTLTTAYRFDGRRISRDNLVVFHGYHPDGSEQGVSPLETLRRVLAEEWAASTHREWFWRNAARQAGVIERPREAPEWGTEAKQRFRQQWDTMTRGGLGSGNTVVLEDGMKWNPTGFSPKDSEYIEGRRLTYEEVARVYAPSLVGLLSVDSQRANVESYHRQLYQDVLAPICRMIQDEIDNQLLSEDEYDYGIAGYSEFNLKDKLKGSFEEEVAALTTAVGVPHLSINEARARQNLPRIDEEWADTPVQPMNVIYGGQAATTMPVGGGTGEAADDSFSTKLEHFFDRQEKALVARLGAVKGETPDEDVWQTERWVRELSRLYSDVMPGAEAMKVAAVVCASQRLRLLEAFQSAGVDGVRPVFRESVELAVSQLPVQLAH